MKAILKIICSCLAICACIGLWIWSSAATRYIKDNTVEVPVEYKLYRASDKSAQPREAYILGLIPFAYEEERSTYTVNSMNPSTYRSYAYYCVAVLHDKSTGIVKLYAHQQNPAGITGTMKGYEQWQLSSVQELQKLMKEGSTQEPLHIKGKTSVMTKKEVSLMVEALGTSLSPDDILRLSTETIMLDTTEYNAPTIQKPDILYPPTWLVLLSYPMLIVFIVLLAKGIFAAVTQRKGFSWKAVSEPSFDAEISYISRVSRLLRSGKNADMIAHFTDGYRVLVSYEDAKNLVKLTTLHGEAVSKITGIPYVPPVIEEEPVVEEEPNPVQSNEWECSCGRVHPNYVSSCVCGKTKQDARMASSQIE